MFGISLFYLRWDGRTHLLLPILCVWRVCEASSWVIFGLIDGSCLGGLSFESGSWEKMASDFVLFF